VTDTTTPTTDAPNCRQHTAMTLRTEADPTAAPTWYCPDLICHNEVLRPAAGVTPKGTIEITHTRADGTLLEGSRKGDGVWELVRPHRFTWGRSLPGVLFIRQSRDKRADRWSIDRAAKALRAAGWEVVVDIDEGTRRSFAEAEADRVERAEERTDRFSEYAGNAAGRSEAHRGAADRISKRFEFGQPILMGHHSQRRAERDAERIDQNMRKSFAEADKATHYANRAKASGSFEEFRKNPPRTLRRLDKLRAELRGVERWQRGESNNGYTRALTPATVAELEIRHEELTEEIEFWEHVIKEAEKDGFKVWGPADFKKGDFARMRGQWYEVLRVNKKTLTVPGGPDIQPLVSLKTHVYPGMRGTRPYDEVTARKSAEEMAELLEAARKVREAKEASASA
jgi:hypothetical protein